MRDRGLTAGAMTEDDFDRLAEQDHARKLAKLHANRPEDESPKLRQTAMPQKKSFVDSAGGKWGVDDAILDAAQMDFATSILHDATCCVSVLTEHKDVLQQGKTVTYYGIDVGSEA